MMLRTIALKGYLSIQDMAPLKLNDELNVLIGANGSGKSNFISFFQMLGEMTNPHLGLQRYVARMGGADALLYRGVETTPSMSAVLEFARDNRYEMELESSAKDGLFFAEEVASFSGEYGRTKSLNESGHLESKLHDIPARNEVISFTRRAVTDWRVFHFHNTSPTAPMMRPINVVDNLTLRQNAENIAAFLLRLREEHRDYYDRIIRHIRQAAPFFGDFVLEPQADKIQLLWQELGSEKVYYPHQLSDGTIRFICLATLLLQPEPSSLTIIDEPELGLHPSAITALVGMLRLAQARTQLIVSTQSTNLIDLIELEELIVVDRVNGSSVFRQPQHDELQEWVDDYSLGELWDKNLLGGMPSLP